MMRNLCAVVGIALAIGGCSGSDNNSSGNCAPDQSSGTTKTSKLGAGSAVPCTNADDNSASSSDGSDKSETTTKSGSNSVASIAAIGGKAGSGSSSGGSDSGGSGSGSDTGTSGDGGGEPTVTGDGPAADFVNALNDTNAALCECLGVSIDECTGTTAEERQCQADAASSNESAGGDWLQCAADYLQSQADCVSAAMCDQTELQKCDLFTSTSDDPFADHCGAAPSALEDASNQCAIAAGGAFTCDNGEQIYAEWECDGEADCSDGSDEASCDGSTPGPAPSMYFTCDNGEQIYAEWECDGEADCSDGSDEASCGPDAPSPYFSCDNGEQIYAEWVCDGEDDCGDGSDEADCSSAGVPGSPGA